MCFPGFEWCWCGGGGGLGWWGEVAVCSVVVVVSWCPCQWKGLDGVAGLNVHGVLGINLAWGLLYMWNDEFSGGYL